MFPEAEGVPPGVNIQDLEEPETCGASRESDFVDWIAEGKHDCDIAQALLHA